MWVSERCLSGKLHVHCAHLFVSLELELLMQLFIQTRVIAPHKNFDFVLGILSAYISEVSPTYAGTNQ